MHYIEFLLASIALTLMPGPDILFVIAQSLERGAKAGILIALGLCTGLLGHISASALGLSLIIINSPLTFSVIKYLGAAYLIYLGILSYKNRKKKNEAEGAPNLAMRKLYGRGILMNLLNPKVSLFFLAFLPQFIQTDGGEVSLQIILLGTIFTAQAIIIFSLVSLLSARASGFLGLTQKYSSAMGIINALLFFIIGLSIIWEDVI